MGLSRQGFVSGAKRLYRTLTPALVFSTLGLIAWGGHTFHWDLAHASEAILPVSKETVVESTEPVIDHKIVRITDDFPSMTFSSKQAASNCGIAVEQVSQRSLDKQLATNAEIAYDQGHLAQLSSRVSGTVTHVEKRLGADVRRGDLLALVDSTDVGDAKLELLQACITLHLKTQHRDRLLASQDVIPVRERVESEGAYRLAKTARFNALQRLVNMGFKIELDDVEGLNEKQLEEKLQYLGIPEDKHYESKSYNLIPVVAPFDGTIIRCDIVQGEAVQPLESFYELTDTSKMWVLLNVRQDDATKLHVGMPITFEPGNHLASITGSISWISSEIDPKTRMIQARAEVQNPKREAATISQRAEYLLRDGAFGVAKISLDQQSGLVVPNLAMHWVWEIGQEVVFVSDEDQCTFTPVVVKKGATHDGYVEIESGLTAGKSVVSKGSRILAAELSEHLQEHLGDNSTAVRDFHHSDNISDDLAKAEVK